MARSEFLKIFNKTIIAILVTLGIIIVCLYAINIISELNRHFFNPVNKSSPMKQKWVFKFKSVVTQLSSGEVSEPLLAQDGCIYFSATYPSSDHKRSKSVFYAVRPNGTKKMEFRFNGSPVVSESMPLLSKNNTLFVVTDQNVLFSIDSTGKKKWSFKAKEEIEPPFFEGYDGMLYFMSDNSLNSLDQNGNKKWCFQLDDDATLNPLTDNKNIYIKDSNGNYYVLGEQGVTKTNLDVKKENQLIVYESSTILSRKTVEYSYHESDTGKSLGGVDYDWIDTPITEGNDGMLYFQGRENSDIEPFLLFAVKPNGKLSWKYEPSYTAVKVPAFGKDGTIYIMNHDSLEAITKK